MATKPPTSHDTWENGDKPWHWRGILQYFNSKMNQHTVDSTADSDEILHHQRDGWNSINDGIDQLLTGAGFLPSTKEYCFRKKCKMMPIIHPKERFKKKTYEPIWTDKYTWWVRWGEKQDESSTRLISISPSDAWTRWRFPTSMSRSPEFGPSGGASNAI